MAGRERVVTHSGLSPVSANHRDRSSWRDRMRRDCDLQGDWSRQHRWSQEKTPAGVRLSPNSSKPNGSRPCPQTRSVSILPQCLPMPRSCGTSTPMGHSPNFASTSPFAAGTAGKRRSGARRTRSGITNRSRGISMPPRSTAMPAGKSVVHHTPDSRIVRAILDREFQLPTSRPMQPRWQAGGRGSALRYPSLSRPVILNEPAPRPL